MFLNRKPKAKPVQHRSKGEEAFHIFFIDGFSIRVRMMSIDKSKLRNRITRFIRSTLSRVTVTSISIQVVINCSLKGDSLSFENEFLIFSAPFKVHVNETFTSN